MVSACQKVLVEDPLSVQWVNALNARDAGNAGEAQKLLQRMKLNVARATLPEAEKRALLADVYDVLGRLHASGELGQEDKAMAVHYWQKAEALGNKQAAVKLAKEYLRGEAVTRDLDAAAQRFRAAYPDDPQAVIGLIELLESGYIFNPPLNVSRETMHHQMVGFYRDKMEQGSGASARKLAEIYAEGKVLPQNLPLAEVLLRRAIALGDEKAQKDLATLWFEKPDMRYHKAGIALLERADMPGAGLSAIMKMAKEAQKAGDFSMAREWYEKAAGLGSIRAMHVLGEMALKRQNPEKAAHWFTQAANGGDGEAALMLSRLYVVGLGVAPDAEKSFHYITKAAKAGNAEAMITLGMAYQEGLNMPQDLQKAAYWLEKAEKAGYRHALSFLQGATQ